MFVNHAGKVNPLESEHGEVVYELLGNAAGGAQKHSLAQIVIPPGKASLKHYHPVAEESYYVLAGEGRLEIDDETRIVGPGDSVAIRPEQVHQIANAGDDNLVLLAICVPAWTADNSVYLD